MVEQMLYLLEQIISERYIYHKYFILSKSQFIYFTLPFLQHTIHFIFYFTIYYIKIILFQSYSEREKTKSETSEERE